MTYLVACRPELVESTRQVANQAKINMTKLGHPVVPSCWPVESAIVEMRVFDLWMSQTKKREYRALEDE